MEELNSCWPGKQVNVPIRIEVLVYIRGGIYCMKRSFRTNAVKPVAMVGEKLKYLLFGRRSTQVRGAKFRDDLRLGV